MRRTWLEAKQLLNFTKLTIRQKGGRGERWIDPSDSSEHSSFSQQPGLHLTEPKDKTARRGTPTQRTALVSDSLSDSDKTALKLTG